MVQRIPSGTVLGLRRAVPRGAFGGDVPRRRMPYASHRALAPGEPGDGAVRSMVQGLDIGEQATAPGRRPRWAPAASGRCGWRRRRPSSPVLVARSHNSDHGPARFAPVNRAFASRGQPPQSAPCATTRPPTPRTNRRPRFGHSPARASATTRSEHPVGVPCVVTGASAWSRRPCPCRPATSHEQPVHQPEHDRGRTRHDPRSCAGGTPADATGSLANRQLRLNSREQRIHHPRNQSKHA